MKIGISSADLDKERVDGTIVYLKNVLNLIPELFPEDNFFLYHKKSFNSKLKLFLKDTNFTIRQKKGFFWAQLVFPYLLKRDKLDICWIPFPQVPFFRPKNIKFFVTVHDLAFKYFPETFPRVDFWKHEIFLRYSLKKSTGIIAVSDSTKRDILKFYPKVNPDKIKVIYHGFDRKIFQRKVGIAETRKVFEKYLLIERGRSLENLEYLLFVGAVQPRKGLIDLIEAFEKIKKSKKFQDLKLVLIGSPAWLAKKILERIEKSSNKEDIILTGIVDFEELSVFYQRAKVFVMPSLYEGFGIPILEAMSSGVPVVCARNSSLAEIGKGAVEFFHSGDKEHLACKLEKVLTNEKRSKELILAGNKKIKDFSWRRCASETLDFLHSI